MHIEYCSALQVPQRGIRIVLDKLLDFAAGLKRVRRNGAPLGFRFGFLGVVVERLDEVAVVPVVLVLDDLGSGRVIEEPLVVREEFRVPAVDVDDVATLELQGLVGHVRYTKFRGLP